MDAHGRNERAEFETDVAEEVLRELMYSRTGLVDRKICAIDATSSGLLFSLRPTNS